MPKSSQMEPLDCSCRYFVDPKAPKWSPWGAVGGTLGVLWGPRTLKMGSKWGPWELVGTLWGVKGGQGRLRGPKSINFGPHFGAILRQKCVQKQIWKIALKISTCLQQLLMALRCKHVRKRCKYRCLLKVACFTKNRYPDGFKVLFAPILVPRW